MERFVPVVAEGTLDCFQTLCGLLDKGGYRGSGLLGGVPKANVTSKQHFHFALRSDSECQEPVATLHKGPICGDVLFRDSASDVVVECCHAGRSIVVEILLTEDTEASAGELGRRCIRKYGY